MYKGKEWKKNQVVLLIFNDSLIIMIYIYLTVTKLYVQHQNHWKVHKNYL